MMKGMSRDILRIAIPSIVTNITIPLLGLFDVGIAGHLGNASFIAAVSVGAMMFNLIYWNFGFLRMGTSGMTAQAYGRDDRNEVVLILKRVCLLGVLIGGVIVALQWPLQELALLIISPSQAVRKLALTYFKIGIWGAPATLTMMGIKGWFLGMQDSKRPMFISVGVNVVNIVISVLAVFVFRLGFPGIALGTVCAEYAGLCYSLWLLRSRYPDLLKKMSVGLLHGLNMRGSGHFFGVNGNIFLRSFLLMIVNLAFVAIGARSGDVILAVNALMMQLFTMFSYFMDGIAFAGEALVGKYEGAHKIREQRRCVRLLFAWGMLITAVYTLIYILIPDYIFRLLSDDATVVAQAMQLHWWCVAIPIAGMAAFVWDGVFIGLTRTRAMAQAVLMAVVAFFVIYWVLPDTMGDNALWFAFVSYLSMRGVVQTLQYLMKK